MKTYEAVLAYLHDAGIRNFAGMLGSTNAPYVVGIGGSDDGSRYIAVRHEQVAAAIVDAAGRLERTPGCLLTHGASGALAASLGIAAAARDSVPMLVLSGTQERVAMERGYWQTQDVLRPMSAFAKWQTRVERPDRAVDAVRHALRAAVTGRPGVAQVDLPIDVSTEEYTGEPVPAKVFTAPPHRVMPDPAGVADAVKLLTAAVHPVILVGGGAASTQASDLVARIAAHLHAPVLNTPTSRGVIDEFDPLSFGPSGILGYQPADEVLATADVILAIGSRVSDLQTARGGLLAPTARLIQVDIDPLSISKDRAADVEIVADAASFCQELLALPEFQALSPDAARAGWVGGLREHHRDWFDAWLGAESASDQVQPTEAITELMRQLPQDAILTHGAGDHGFYGYAVPVRLPGTHLVSAALGALGCALGYAIGAKMVRPEQTVVACVGDGEFMLQLGDLETLVRENLPAIVVVFNNFALGSQRKRAELYGTPYGVEHGNPDFARLAQLFGADGIRVDRPGQFAEAFASALTSGRPTVIDVIVDRQARPPRIAISREAR